MAANGASRYCGSSEGGQHRASDPSAYANQAISFYLANAQDTRAIQLYLGHKNIQTT